MQRGIPRPLTVPVTPEQVTINPTMRDACVLALARWDRRDPWDQTTQAQGRQLIELTIDACRPLVPRLESPEVAVKFLRAALTSQNQPR